jgi:hypothetical protein
MCNLNDLFFVLQIIVISFPVIDVSYADRVYIYDGYNESAPLLADVTGAQNSLQYYRTSQRYMFVKFTSGSSVSSYTGFNATFLSYLEPGA